MLVCVEGGREREHEQGTLLNPHGLSESTLSLQIPLVRANHMFPPECKGPGKCSPWLSSDCAKWFQAKACAQEPPVFLGKSVMYTLDLPLFPRASPSVGTEGDRIQV